MYFRSISNLNLPSITFTRGLEPVAKFLSNFSNQNLVLDFLFAFQNAKNFRVNFEFKIQFNLLFLFYLSFLFSPRFGKISGILTLFLWWVKLSFTENVSLSRTVKPDKYFSTLDLLLEASGLVSDLKTTVSTQKGILVSFSICFGVISCCRLKSINTIIWKLFTTSTSWLFG